MIISATINISAYINWCVKTDQRPTAQYVEYSTHFITQVTKKRIIPSNCTGVADTEFINLVSFLECILLLITY
jgi:hypothetical protein